MAPFTITAQGTLINADPAPYRALFDTQDYLLFNGAFDATLLAKLIERAANATFVENLVERIGLREIEAPQRIGATLGLLLGRFALLDWLQAVTGLHPLRATMGRLVQTRANGRDALDWHDDMEQDHRKLGLVVNLSDQPFSGGEFEMRRKGEDFTLHSVKHHQPGTIMIFAVNTEIEHRVTSLIEGGPRRVYAGWILSQPEHLNDPLARW